jgi:carbonic anhydrase/acetyltransferase-like protein (isoleucine patch superfamily)
LRWKSDVKFDAEGRVVGAHYDVGEPDLEHTEWVTPLVDNPGLRHGMYRRKNDYNDEYSKHRQQISFEGGKVKPHVAGNAWVSPSCTLAGHVEVWHHSSIWHNVVVRGDVKMVRIGAYTNLQDGTVVDEAFQPLGVDHEGSTIIGHYVTIGHGCVLRACTIENECHIGMGSILMDGAYLEQNVMLGANTVVQPNTRIPSGQLWIGNPARYLRDLTDDEKAWIVQAAEGYNELAMRHKEEEFLEPHSYLQAEKEGYGDKVGWRARLFDGTFDGQ